MDVLKGVQPQPEGLGILEKLGTAEADLHRASIQG